MKKFYWQLDSTQIETDFATNIGCDPLIITTPVANASLDSAYMFYVRDDYHLQHYAFHQWVDTPAKMLHPLLLQAFETSGLFSAVVGSNAVVERGYRLDSRIVDAVQRHEGQQSKVKLSIHWLLQDIKQREIVLARTSTIEESVQGDLPYDGVKAMNKAVAKALHQVVQQIKQLVRCNK